MRRMMFDEIEAPSRVERPGRVIDREEMVAVARTWDPSPIRLSDEAARAFGGVAASGACLPAFRLRLIHAMARQPAVIASFGHDEVRFRTPAHGGDRLTLFLDFVSTRPSSSRPDRGIATLRRTLTNRDGAKVPSAPDSVLARRTPA